MTDLLAYCRERTDEVLALLERLVAFDSFSIAKPEVDRLVDFVAEQFAALGADIVERHPRAKVGDMLLAKWGADLPGKPITLLMHLDTVWPVGTAAERLPRIEGGRWYGPGGADMKGRVAISLAALRGLRDRGEFPARPIWILANTDEETGSVYSGDLIREVARQSGLCLVMEPGTPEGTLKVWRKGVADFHVRAKGRASHAGAAPEAGINAIVEIAHQIVRINALNDLKNGTSVTVTKISGGVAGNVVPDSAEIHIDARYLTRAEYERIHAALRDLYPVLPGAELDVWPGDFRPPLEYDDKGRQAFAQAKRIAEGIGVTIYEGGSGGGSDGNLTSAEGTPTLDGMGPTGDGLHALHENVLISSVPEKMALLMAILRDWQM